MESELAGLGPEDRAMFLADMGVSDEECGLQVILLLGLGLVGYATVMLGLGLGLGSNYLN